MPWPANWISGQLISAAALNQWTAALRNLDVEPQRHSAIVSASNVSIPHNTWTLISFGSPSLNVGGVWSSSQPSRLTIPNGRRIVLIIEVGFAANNTGRREARIKQAGAVLYQYAAGAVSGGSDTRITALLPASVPDAGTYFEVELFQNSGGALIATPVIAAIYRTW